MRYYLEQLLAPLFVCNDCNGIGKREYAIYPEIKEVDYNNTIIDNDSFVCYKIYKKCETCKGTGRN